MSFKPFVGKREINYAKIFSHHFCVCLSLLTCAALTGCGTEKKSASPAQEPVTATPTATDYFAAALVGAVNVLLAGVDDPPIKTLGDFEQLDWSWLLVARGHPPMSDGKIYHLAGKAVIIDGVK